MAADASAGEPSEEDLVGEWVTRALEAPNGEELGRMLRNSRREEAAWRRLRAAELRLRQPAAGRR